MISTVLFDAGNTLVWVDHTLIAATAGIPDPEDVRKADRALRQAMNDHLLNKSTESCDFFQAYHGGMLRDAGLPAGEIPAALERLRKVDRILSLWRRANPEARPAVKALKAKGIRVGIVSNSDGRCSTLLEACGLDDLFEMIIDSHIVQIEKPDPRIFLLACERMGIRPENTAYVGDIPCVDVTGSRSAGLTPILYDPLDAFPEWKDCARIRDLRALPKILE